MIISIEEYIEISKTTAVYPAGSLYPFLGLVGESGEVLEHILNLSVYDIRLNNSEFRKEIGDVLWYIAAIIRDYDLPYGSIHANTKNIVEDSMQIVIQATKIAEFVKKDIRKKVDIDSSRFIEPLHRIVGLLESISLRNGTTLLEVARMNLNKLFARYNVKN